MNLSNFMNLSFVLRLKLIKLYCPFSGRFVVLLLLSVWAAIWLSMLLKIKNISYFSFTGTMSKRRENQFFQNNSHASNCLGWKRLFLKTVSPNEFRWRYYIRLLFSQNDQLTALSCESRVSLALRCVSLALPCCRARGMPLYAAAG